MYCTSWVWTVNGDRNEFTCRVSAFLIFCLLVKDTEKTAIAYRVIFKLFESLNNIQLSQSAHHTIFSVLFCAMFPNAFFVASFLSVFVLVERLMNIYWLTAWNFNYIYIYAAYTEYSGLCDSVLSLGKTHVSELETSKIQVPANKYTIYLTTTTSTQI